jgi:hypothetical protein
MKYQHYTNVPNIIIDNYLPKLSGSELKVLSVIIRQTFGWIDKQTGKPKKWDWISRQFFAKKTSLSLRTVSQTIATLHSKNYIRIKNQDGKIMSNAVERRRAYKLYYSVNIDKPCAKKNLKPMQKSNPTIITHTNSRDTKMHRLNFSIHSNKQ